MKEEVGEERVGVMLKGLKQSPTSSTPSHDETKVSSGKWKPIRCLYCTIFTPVKTLFLQVSQTGSTQ